MSYSPCGIIKIQSCEYKKEKCANYFHVRHSLRSREPAYRKVSGLSAGIILDG